MNVVLFERGPLSPPHFARYAVTNDGSQQTTHALLTMQNIIETHKIVIHADQHFFLHSATTAQIISDMNTAVEKLATNIYDLMIENRVTDDPQTSHTTPITSTSSSSSSTTSTSQPTSDPKQPLPPKTKPTSTSTSGTQPPTSSSP